jgi:hypothetical protein
VVSCLRKLPRSERDRDGCVKDKERGVGGAVQRHGVGFGPVQRFGLRMWRAMLLGYILVWAQRGPIDHGIGPKTGSMSLDLFSSSLSNDSQRLLKKKVSQRKKKNF